MQTIKQKLSSRKFWAAVVAWATSLLTAFNVSDSVIVRITLIISGIGALMVYILAESYVDGKHQSQWDYSADYTDYTVQEADDGQ